MKTTARRVLAILLAPLMAVSALFLTAVPASAHAPLTPEQESGIARIYQDINAYRAALGLNPVEISPEIQVVALDWSESQAATGVQEHNMVFHQQIPPGSSWRSELVASLMTPETVVRNAANSPSHEATLSRATATHVGVGMAYTPGTQRAYYTLIFATYPPLAAPASASADISTIGTARINFSAVSGATGYRVTLYQGTSGTVVGQQDVTNTQATFTGLNRGQQYTYTITTIRNGKDQNTSPRRSFSWPAADPSAMTPANATQTIAPNSLSHRWTVPANPDNITIQGWQITVTDYRSDVSHATWVPYVAGQAAYQNTFTGNFLGGQTYNTTIHTVTGSGNSNPVNFTAAMPAPPAAVSNVAFSTYDSNSRLRVTWSHAGQDVANIAYYVSIREQGSNAAPQEFRVNGATAYNFATAVIGRTYVATVTPYNQYQQAGNPVSSQPFLFAGGQGGTDSPDSDGDGVSDDEESYFGSNPQGANRFPFTRRFEGIDRFETNAAVSQFSIAPGAPVFIVSGENFPDALSAGPAAASVDGALLLTTTGSLQPSTVAEIRRIAPSQVYIIGGPNSVSDNVISQVRQIRPNANIERVAGIDRFETSALVADRFFPGRQSDVLIASGAGFPDALGMSSAGSMPGRERPVLLTWTDSIPDSIQATLRRMSPSNIYVAGGPNTIATAQDNLFRNLTGARVTRFAGIDRFETSAMIATHFAPTNQATIPVIYVSGLKFPDALSASMLTARTGSPLMLTLPDCRPGSTGTSPYGAVYRYIVGGPSSVASGTEGRRC